MATPQNKMLLLLLLKNLMLHPAALLSGTVSSLGDDPTKVRRQPRRWHDVGLDGFTYAGQREDGEQCLRLDRQEDITYSQYWRKHQALQDFRGILCGFRRVEKCPRWWMDLIRSRIWMVRSNGIPLELHMDDLDLLEKKIINPEGMFSEPRLCYVR